MDKSGHLKYDLLLQGIELHSAMVDLKPTRIAVAYIGQNWEKLIDKKILREIVLSPALGSNPKGIEQLVNRLGWENVHFLDELHAKVFLSKKWAIVGSPNLSHHALGDSQASLIEMGIALHDQGRVAKLHRYITDLIDKAKVRYRSTASKEKRLARLKELWKRAERAGIIPKTRDHTPQFHEYMEERNIPFDISWYHSGEIHKHEKAIVKEVPDWPNIRTECYEMVFTGEDDIKQDGWVLTWKANQDGTRDKRASPEWFRIDYPIPNGAYGAPYTTLALFRPSLKPLFEPFQITSSFIKAFDEALKIPKYRYFRGEAHKESWTIAPARRLIKQFLKDIQNNMKE